MYSTCTVRVTTTYVDTLIEEGLGESDRTCMYSMRIYIHIKVT